ncbi:unnamed protein product [Spirodela intermedia]|uniref:Kinesin motor domain-containing protein n=1 Tax=Spirodela intermedia TaxID=51605 RepID=A0ABN7EBN4_SPIIN|nr:unnamed protein product [Spirodela intermedia]
MLEDPSFWKDHNVQEKLFKVAGVPMVDNCVSGYNSCMFAYGQTGSGKTHTMLGDIEGGTRRHSVNCGMTPRVFEYLFSKIQKASDCGFYLPYVVAEKEARREEKLQQKSSGAEGERLKEATNINKSLSTLGLVIMNLVGISNKKALHVPYRDSKLTFLLQVSIFVELGLPWGNSKTIIIANISPSNWLYLVYLMACKFIN